MFTKNNLTANDDDDDDDDDDDAAASNDAPLMQALIKSGFNFTNYSSLRMINKFREIRRNQVSWICIPREPGFKSSHCQF